MSNITSVGRRNKNTVLLFDFEDYKKALPGLHMCYCGKNSKSNKLFKCQQCKATYYCCVEHQRSAWNAPTFVHKDFCGKLQNYLQEGYGSIEKFMSKFSPQNAANITLGDALQGLLFGCFVFFSLSFLDRVGWSIASAALEREIYENSFEEAKYLFWAGTCHAMVSGQIMKSNMSMANVAPPYEELVGLFHPSMNFFENVLVVMSKDERRLEITPFARFELFGLWSSLALSKKRETDAAPMMQMFVEASVRYGKPAIEEMVDFLLSDSPNIVLEQCFGNLQQWINSVMQFLTLSSQNFEHAEGIVETLRRFAEESTGQMQAAAGELHLFGSLLFTCAKQAHIEMATKYPNVSDSQWTEEQMEECQKIKEEHLRAAVAQLQQQHQQAQGMGQAY